MTNTVGVGPLWEWLEPALHDLRQGYAEDPATSWEDRREALLARLGVEDASEHPVTEELLQSLDELDDEDRDELLRGDQLDAMAYAVAERHAEEPSDADPADAGQGDYEQPADAAPETDTEYDEDAWHAFTAEYLPAWDGSPGSWDQFKEWFAYYADQRGLVQPAGELLSYLDRLDGPGRIATFAGYGVVVAPVEGPPAEEEPAASAPVQLDPATEAILAEVVAEDPEEFADISEERLRELMAEALAEVAEEAAQQEERETDEELT